MKKRILAFTLIFAMLFSMAIVPAVADAETPTFSRPLGASDPNMSRLLPTKAENGGAVDLADYQSKVISFGLSTDNANPTDITKGFSVIGATAVNGLAGAVDNAWASSSSIKNPTYVEHLKYDFNPSVFYNVQGESGTKDATHIYTTMMTFNFGKIKAIEAFGFIQSNPNGLLQAADIYVSNDGQNWILVDYYDRLFSRLYDGDYGNYQTNIYTGALGTWADKNENVAAAAGSDGGRLWIFNLTEIQNAQYLRIAGTTTFGATNAGWNTVKAGADDTAKENLAYTAGAGCTAANNSGVASVNLNEVLVFGADIVSATDVQMKDNAEDATAFDARFVVDVKDSFVNDANAKQINFKISAVYEGEDGVDKTVAEKTYFTNYVTTSIMAEGEPVNAAAGSKFALFEITGIPKNVKVTFTVTPEVEYKNGTKIAGQAMTFSPNGAYTPDVTE